MEREALIGQGRTADVYAWGQGRIVKLYQAWMPASAVEQEFVVTRAAQAAGLPVPAADELVEIEGRRGIVFERVTGPTMLKDLQTRPWRLFAAARQLGELHAQIHACTLPPELPSQRQQIEHGIGAAKDLPAACQQAARRCLARLPDGEALCHGDFHPDNIILTAGGPVVIDWLTGTRGHPLADVARTSLILQTGDLPPGIPLPMRLLLNASRRWLHTLYLRRYAQLRPVARRHIEVWRPPLMAARLCELDGYPQERRLLTARLETALAEERNLL